jgi:predicted transcriptional regulator
MNGRGADPDQDESSGSAYFVDLWDDAGTDVTERFRSAETPEWDVLGEHTVEEAMSREVVTLPPDASLEAAAEYMRRTGAHRVLVANHDTLLGMVTTMDITRYVAGLAPANR